MSHQAPAEPRIALQFEKFSAFVEGYGANLSLGGMFLATEERRPTGSIVDFEIKLADGFRLLKGLGEVLWIRPHAAGADLPAGMGVRFQALDDSGRELILRILEERVKTGLEPFDVEQVPADLAIGAEDATAAAGGVQAPPRAVAPAAEVPAPEPEAAPNAATAAPRSAPDLEQKILGEDGFTLLEAEQSLAGAGATRTDRAFEELAFDAPWGEALPELPEEILGEGPESDRESASSDLIAAMAEAEAAAGSGPRGDPGQDAIDDSLLVAAEAAEEIDVSPPSGDVPAEPEFDDIDFSVPGEDEAALPTDLDAGDAVAEFAFDPDPQDQLAPHQPTAEVASTYDDLFADGGDEDLTVAGAGASAIDEDPTLVTSEPPAPTFEVGPAADDPEPRLTFAEEVDGQIAGSGFDATFEAVADVALSVVTPSADQPPAPEAASALTPGPAIAEPTARPPAGASNGSDAGVATVSVAGAPAPVQDYEDDLFAGESGAGPGQVIRQALSGRLLAAAALLLVLGAAAFFFRSAIAEMVGLAGPDAALPRAAGGPPAANEPGPKPPSPETTLPSSGAGQPGVPGADPIEDVGIEEVEVPETLPPAAGVVGDSTADADAGSPAVTQPLDPAVASRVKRIAWRRQGDGTLVTVSLDGRLDDSRYLHMPLGYNPAKEMVKITGIDEPYLSGRIAVGSPELEQIRVGYHTPAGGTEIHVVFDYPSAGPRVVAVHNLGDRLEVQIASP